MAVKKSLPSPASLDCSDMPAATARQLPVIETTFARYEEALRTISLKIHEYKELSFQEHRSSRLLSDFLEAEGFILERGVAGRPTAFVATYAQDHGPIVSFNAVTSRFAKLTEGIRRAS